MSFFRWVEAEKIFTSSVPSSLLIRIVGSFLTDDEGEDERLDEGEDGDGLSGGDDMFFDH